MKNLTPFIYLFPFLISISFKGIDTVHKSTSYEEEANTTLAKVMGLDPFTKIQLPSTLPYPFRTEGGNKIPYELLIRIPNANITSQNEIESIFDQISVALHINLSGSGEPNPNSPEGLIDWARTNLYPILSGEGFVIKGELDLSFNIEPGSVLGYWAYLLENQEIIDRFYTEVTTGAAELTINSTIQSFNMMEQGMSIRSVVSGKAALGFDATFSNLTGRGPLIYEVFTIETSQSQCSVSTTKTDGTWNVAEILLPVANGQSYDLPLGANSATIAPPNEAVIFIEPTIKESAKIRCPPSPIAIPLPLIHYFAVFYSMHGGEVDIIGPSGNTTRPPNEMDEGRGGLVMKDWSSGTGSILATKTYQRSGKRDKGTFEEDTRFELSLNWGGGEEGEEGEEDEFPVYCGLDNTDIWLPDNHGWYNCSTACETGNCNLEVLVDNVWQPLNRAKEERDVVDQMVGQPLPADATSPPAFPTWVRCNCN